ncbi:MAG: hypothetical protein QXT19_01840 [Candidatus Woesearchaeota archaeon]
MDNQNKPRSSVIGRIAQGIALTTALFAAGKDKPTHADLAKACFNRPTAVRTEKALPAYAAILEAPELEAHSEPPKDTALEALLDAPDEILPNLFPAQEGDTIVIPKDDERKAPSAGSDIYFRGIAGLEAYFDSNKDKLTGKAKGIVDLGKIFDVCKTNLYAQGTAFYLDQDMDDDITATGKGVRGELGADLYFNLFKNGKLLLRTGLNAENRDYEFKDSNSSKLKIGNKSTGVTGEVAVGESGLENEDYVGVTKNFNHVRARISHRKGDVTGDIEGSHEATNVDAEGHLKVGSNLALHGGASYFTEDMAGLKQRIVAAELGLGYHADWGYLRGAALAQLRKESEEKCYGGKFEAGIRVLSTKNFALDLTGEAGALRVNADGHSTGKDETEYFAGLGVNVYGTSK